MTYWPFRNDAGRRWVTLGLLTFCHCSADPTPPPKTPEDARAAKEILLRGQGTYEYQGRSGTFEAKAAGHEPTGINGERKVKLEGTGQFEGKGAEGRFTLALEGELVDVASDYERPASFLSLEGFTGLWFGGMSRYADLPIGIRVAIGSIPDNDKFRFGVEAAYAIAALDTDEIAGRSDFGGGVAQTSDRFQVAEAGLLMKRYGGPRRFLGVSFHPGVGGSFGVAHFDRIRLRCVAAEEAPDTPCTGRFDLRGQFGLALALPVEMVFGDPAKAGARFGFRPTLYAFAQSSATLLLPLVIGGEF